MSEAFWLITVLIMGFLLVIALQEWERVRQWREMQEREYKQQAEWREERRQLLDRVQSPSFAEYKQAEVKVIKAQNGDKEPPRLEPL